MQWIVKSQHSTTQIFLRQRLISVYQSFSCIIYCRSIPYKAKFLSWNGAWVETGRSHGESEGVNFSWGFSYCVHFAPCGLPLFQLRRFAAYRTFYDSRTNNSRPQHPMSQQQTHQRVPFSRGSADWSADAYWWRVGPAAARPSAGRKCLAAEWWSAKWRPAIPAAWRWSFCAQRQAARPAGCWARRTLPGRCRHCRHCRCPR